MSQAPSLSIPKSDQTCQLYIINTTCDITCPPNFLVEPKIEGYEWMNLPTFSFLIKHHKSGRQLLFDLGSRKDWENSVPHIRDLIAGHVNAYKVTKNVTEILAENSVDVNDIEAFILSHWHFDHSGAPSELPRSMKLIVGPGFRDAFLPGWPAKETSPFHEADFEGREVVEAPFTDLKIGQFQAYDYFGDGSLYILNVPGHAIGHISALVRTTADTFVFLGGDACHFTGVIRPTKYIPMPDNIPEETALDKAIPRGCPCSAFMSSHPEGSDARETPFLKVSTDAATFYADPPTAQQSVYALTEFDADPNVLIAIAHDPTSLDVFDFFPKEMTDWKKRNWKKICHWGFLSELPYNGKTVRPHLADGLYKGGQKVRGIETS